MSRASEKDKPQTSILLNTERLILRSFTANDGEHLYKLDNDPEVMRYINGGIATSREIIEDRILPVFLQYDEEVSGFGFWAVIEKNSSDFLGWCCLRPDKDSPGDASLGYRFCRTSWGRGYATEGSRALIHKGFTELHVQRVVATTFEDNLASRRVMEKLGFKLVRTFRVDLSDQQTAYFASSEPWDGDDLEYTLEKTEWEQQ